MDVKEVPFGRKEVEESLKKYENFVNNVLRRDLNLILQTRENLFSKLSE